MTKKHVTGARLYFENGTRRRLEFTASVADIEVFRKLLKLKHGAKVVWLEYESKD